MEGSRKALIVANDEYEQAGLRNLQAPTADADALERVLGDRQIGDFAVQIVRNQPAHIIQAQIEELFSESRPGDVLLLHFSCHGLKSESGELFFAAANTRPDRLGSTAVSADFVQRCMRASRSRSVVLLLDCCYGAAFAQGVTVRAAADVNVLDSFPHERLGGGRGRAVITACSAMEYAFEGDRLTEDRSARPSVFTTALVEGLASGEADRDEDGWVSLSELYDYVFDKVREQNPHQTPSCDVEMEGELYLARSQRRRMHAAPIPPDLRAAMTTPNMFTRLGMVSELRSRLASDNLTAAVAAYEALTEIARTDIQSVADVAAAAVRAAIVRPAQTELKFGQVAQGSAAPHQTVQLLGPAIARACVPRPSHDWIRVNQAAGKLDISIDTARAGVWHGSVDLKGPTGDAVIAIEVDLVLLAPQALPSADHLFPVPSAGAGPPEGLPSGLPSAQVWPHAATLPIAQSPPPRRPWWHSHGVLSTACAAVLVIGGGTLAFLRYSDGTGGAPALAVPGCTTMTAKVAAQAGRQVTQDGGFVPVTGKPWGVQAISRYLFVSAGKSVEVFSNNKGNLAPTWDRSIPAPGVQKGQAITRDDRYLLATAGSGAFVINIAQAGEPSADPIRTTLVSQDGKGAVEAAISRDGKFAFVTLQASRQVAVFDLGKAVHGSSSYFVGFIPFTLQPVGITTSPGGYWLYVTSMGSSNGNDPGEGMLSVISVFRAEHKRSTSTSIVSTVRAGCSPARVITSKTGKVVWVTARQSNALLGFSAAKLRKDPSRALIAKVAVGANPIGLALIDGGRRIVIGDSHMNKLPGAAANLAIVSTSKALARQPALVGVVRSGLLPRELVLEPGGKTLLVTNENSQQLQLVNVARLP